MTFHYLCYFPWLSRPGKWSPKFHDFPWPGGALYTAWLRRVPIAGQRGDRDSNPRPADRSLNTRPPSHTGSIWVTRVLGFPTDISQRLLRSLPEVSYGCASWTLKNDKNRINSFQMKAIKQLLLVSWTDSLRQENEWLFVTKSTYTTSLFRIYHFGE